MHSTAAPQIHIAPASHQDAIVQALTVAFSSDPAVRWTWPEPTAFLEYFPRFIRAFGGNAFHHDSAYQMEGNTGAALWLPPGVGSVEDGIDQALRSSLSEARQQEVFGLLDKMGAYHPAEPHWPWPWWPSAARTSGPGPARPGSVCVWRGVAMATWRAGWA